MAGVFCETRGTAGGHEDRKQTGGCDAEARMFHRIGDLSALTTTVPTQCTAIAQAEACPADRAAQSLNSFGTAKLCLNQSQYLEILLQIDDAMPRTFLAGVLYQQRRQRIAVQREELDAADEALLQMRVGIEVQSDGGSVFA